jgi:hypothetical protein
MGDDSGQGILGGGGGWLSISWRVFAATIESGSGAGPMSFTQR